MRCRCPRRNGFRMLRGRYPPVGPLIRFIGEYPQRIEVSSQRSGSLNLLSRIQSGRAGVGSVVCLSTAPGRATSPTIGCGLAALGGLCFRLLVGHFSEAGILLRMLNGHAH